MRSGILRLSQKVMLCIGNPDIHANKTAGKLRDSLSGKAE